MKRHIKRAFTLVEILIVVVILGILAAVVVPQFANAGDQAQVGNIETQLRTLRTQIQLYRAQNNNELPTAGDLWDELIDNGLIQDEPVNPRNNLDVVGTEPGDANGWIFNEDSGELWAQDFNEDHRADGTDDPWSDDWEDGVDFGG